MRINYNKIKNFHCNQDSKRYETCDGKSKIQKIFKQINNMFKRMSTIMSNVHQSQMNKEVKTSLPNTFDPSCCKVLLYHWKKDSGLSLDNYNWTKPHIMERNFNHKASMLILSCNLCMVNNRIALSRKTIISSNKLLKNQNKQTWSTKSARNLHHGYVDFTKETSTRKFDQMIKNKHK